MNRAAWIASFGLSLALSCTRVGAGTGGAHATTTTGAGGGTSPCAATSVQGIAIGGAVGSSTSLGYPPYAIDGCELVYVAATPEELRARDLATGSERVIAPSTELPARPSISGGLVAWEASEGGNTVVRFLDLGAPGAVAATVQGPFDHAGEPRVAAGSISFTGWLGAPSASPSDVFVFDTATGAVTDVAMGAGQRRFSDISATHVAWSDFSEGPTGIFNDAPGDAADIVVLDRTTGVVARRAKLGKQAFPMLGADGKIAYLDWGTVHPEPKLSEYDLVVGDVGGGVTTDVLVRHIQTSVYLRPEAKGTFLEWVENAPTTAAPTLTRVSVDLAAAPVSVSSFAGQSVFGPTAATSLTLVGVVGQGGPAHLEGFAR